MSLVHFYRKPALSAAKKNELLSLAHKKVSPDILEIETENCFNVEITAPLIDRELVTLRWLLAETFEPDNFSEASFLTQELPKNTQNVLIEVGPRMSFSTAWSTNAVSVCHACGLTKIRRIERSRRYRLISGNVSKPPFPPLSKGARERTIELSSSLPQPLMINLQSFLDLIHDRMTECQYTETIRTFETGTKPESYYIVPLIEQGKDALRKINTEMGLGLDDWDVEYYYNLFVHDIGRNPTNVECFDLGQSNSEHSRHWFFKGRLFIDGTEMSYPLMDLIKQPLEVNPGNSFIAFKDNSSAIRGFNISTIIPEYSGKSSRFQSATLNYHIIFTAETHNFPTGVAPFPGAETGTGGRIRDVHATGRGSLVVAGTAAYCVGNLRIPDYSLPWEDPSFTYPLNLASPLQIEIEASNGASDYGNKFGEPLIQGFTRSFGLRLPDGERREWVKPIMFTGGIGQLDSRHIEKGEPEKGMYVIKIGGPAYRIGIGGGAASSMIQGENIAELDFSAVQRGDAEMEQKVNRVIRACVEKGEDNPIISIHDQGAGGNCNVVKEIIYPAGAKIEIRNVLTGDSTLSVLEIWGAEYQELNALLVRPERNGEFLAFCRREKVPCSVIGEITGDGYIILYDETDGSTPVNLDLSKVLGEMPQKTFHLERMNPVLEPLRLADDLTVRDALGRVLRLVSVGSKRFLTNKVDRSVTGLIARQQCVGPLQLTLSNVAVIGQSHFGLTGAAISIGEQPIKGLISPQAMARMSVGEALTNIMWAKVSALEDIKCSGNWMWAAKLPGEGARLYDAAVALKDILLELGIAIDGGKDSLSMAAKVADFFGRTELVKSPGTLVISAYASCPDITQTITPDIKRPGDSKLLYIDLGGGRDRLGGSALAHVYGQIGNESPDVDEPELLNRSFKVIQRFISEDLILSGHDRSDGGLVTTLLEMAFGGNCGIEIDISPTLPLPLAKSETLGLNPEISQLFSEELGLVIEYMPKNEEKISAILKDSEIPHQMIGKTTREKEITIRVNDRTSLKEDMRELRAIWEETSYHLERLQANPDCVDEEQKIIFDGKGAEYFLTFIPKKTSGEILNKQVKPKVAVIREEGSNGDREMASAFYHAGFEVWDLSMTDLLERNGNLDDFRGVVFVGGFSYADVLDSAKGWSAVIRFNNKLYEQFQRFYKRPDTFSLGVCNGCQLMALLGWIPWSGISDEVQPRFIQNKSGRFESRFSTVQIISSPSIMLKGMEGSRIGVWIAHGEGRLYFPEKTMLQEVINKNLAPVRFVDDRGELTEKYPFNANGSPSGITALCSPDGRHLGMMPHPERTFLKWQWAYMSEDLRDNLEASPWLQMFQNAREWCEQSP
jgi:phosphoribosylformylglycinamidine synthase